VQTNEARIGGSISSAFRRQVAIAIVCGLIVILVAPFIWRRLAVFRWTEFADTFHHLEWGWLATALILALSTYVGRVLRWEVMLRPFQAKTHFWRLLSSTTIGFTAVVLFGRPGEVVRPYLIARREQVPFSSQMAAWMLERICDLLVVLLLFGIALGGLGNHDAPVGPRAQWVLNIAGEVVTVTCALCFVFLLGVARYGRPFAAWVLRRLRFLPAALWTKIDFLTHSFLRGLECTREPKALALLIGYSALEWLIVLGCNFALFQAFAPTAKLTMMDVLLYLGFVVLGSIVQIPGVGGGSQVAAVIVLTEFFGLQLEAASGIAILSWLITWVSIVPFGLILAARDGLQWSKLKNIEIEKSS
jgi:uncharacterized protein (TIRG00374 family)